jgi:hypothetical protein
MRKISTLLMAIVLVLPAYLRSQTITPSVQNVTGGSAKDGYYRFDWSVGELCVIESYFKPALFVTNGFLQPHTERVNNPSNALTSGDIFMFPNPAYENTEIDILVPQRGRVYLYLTDAQGRLVHTRHFDHNGIPRIEKLSLQPFPAGTYFLKVVLNPTDFSDTRKGSFKLVHLTR